jgi:hypothetical protein
VALARVGMYGREHVVIVRPGKHGMLAHTMFYVDEIRSESEFRTDLTGRRGKELDLAKTFLEALEAPFAPEEFKDEYHAELGAMIARKAAQAGPTQTGGADCCRNGGGFTGSFTIGPEIDSSADWSVTAFSPVCKLGQDTCSSVTWVFPGLELDASNGTLIGAVSANYTGTGGDSRTFAITF